MKLSKTLRRFAIVTTLLLFIGFGLWWVVWSIGAWEYQNIIDHIIGTVREEGYQISYDDRRLFGFPHHVAMRIKNLRWKSSEGITFTVPEIDIASLPWSWYRFEAHFKRHAQIEVPLASADEHFILASDYGRATVTLDDEHAWRDARLTLSNASIGRLPDYLIAIQDLELSSTRPEEVPDTPKKVGLTINGRAKGLIVPKNIPTPFGLEVDRIAMSARVMGVVPDLRKKTSVEIWNKESGVVNFDHFDLDWGVLHMRTRGTIGFDDDLQPEGAFSGAIRDHEEVLKQLLDKGFIPQHQAGMLSSALSLFAHPTDQSDGPGIELPITVQLGGLFIGPVRIFTFPEIMWN